MVLPIIAARGRPEAAHGTLYGAVALRAGAPGAQAARRAVSTSASAAVWTNM